MRASAPSTTGRRSPRTGNGTDLHRGHDEGPPPGRGARANPGTQDPGSRTKGGKYSINRKNSPMVKRFNEVAFSLSEGEISEPFETEYGFFIIYLEKIRGQEYDIRTILLRPKN